MKILVVNDDGYQSEGIKILANTMREYGTVYVVAPHIEQSAKSVSITIHQGLVIHKTDDYNLSIEGTPSDCVKYALYGMGIDFDLVVSGINRGYNIGIDTIYSGTIGACMEALMAGKQAIAFSSDLDEFENAKKHIKEVIDYIFDYDLLSPNYLLSVNFNPQGTQAKGIEITDLGIQRFHTHYEIIDGKHHTKREFLEFDYAKKTDVWAVKHGYISITPLKLGNGDETIVRLLQEKALN